MIIKAADYSEIKVYFMEMIHSVQLLYVLFKEDVIQKPDKEIHG